MIKAMIIADSISAHTNQRITTFELEFPRFILAEVNTHRALSRNSASSRAIPIDKMIEQVQNNPAMPIHWGLNQSGMQAKDEQIEQAYGINAWIDARNRAIESARQLQELGLHKQIVNRVLEPFQTMKTLVTATSFDNFFNLRCHKDAQPEIRQLANLMYQEMQKSTPEVLQAGEWHTPYVQHERNLKGELLYFIETDIFDTNRDRFIPEYLSKDDAIKISCSCAAQVSYRKNDTSIEKALAIYERLINSKPSHSSPCEHCATPIDIERTREGITHFTIDDVPCSGNFTNWVQFRQLISDNVCHKYIPHKD